MSRNPPDLPCDLAPPDPVIECIGKQAFATKADAMNVIRLRKKRLKARIHHHKGKRSQAARDEVYQCVHCRAFHIGQRHRPRRIKP